MKKILENTLKKQDDLSLDEKCESMILMESKYDIASNLRNASAIDENFINVGLENKKICEPLIAEAIKA